MIYDLKHISPLLYAMFMASSIPTTHKEFKVPDIIKRPCQICGKSTSNKTVCGGKCRKLLKKGVKK